MASHGGRRPIKSTELAAGEIVSRRKEIRQILVDLGCVALWASFYSLLPGAADHCAKYSSPGLSFPLDQIHTIFPTLNPSAGLEGHNYFVQTGEVSHSFAFGEDRT